MNNSLRTIRLFVLLLAGLSAVFLNNTMTGFPVLFAVALAISAGLTVIYIFLNFDKQLNEKLIMELIADGFSGMVLFTYPFSDERFFLIVFAFWIAWSGTLWLTSGFFNPAKKNMMWFYILAGIVFIVLGFVLMNYTQEMINSAIYVIGFSLILYGAFGLYLKLVKKTDIY